MHEKCNFFFPVITPVSWPHNTLVLPCVWMLLLHDHRTLEHLGSGEFGVVTQGLLNTVYGDVEVAVKSLNTDANAKEKLQFLQEAAIMCQFNHQNVIKLHGIVTDTPAMIVLEYMSRGDLKNLLETLQPS